MTPEDARATWTGTPANLCHDWLTGMRGGERCLELLADMFDDAHIYTLIHNREAVSEIINRHPITTSRLQTLPNIMERYRNYLPFFPMLINQFEPREAAIQISTSHCVAKSLKPRPGTPHLSYCFTPMRYAWTFYEEYFGTNPLKALVLKPILASLRRWDARTSNRVDHFIAISKHVQDRIQRFYGRESTIVYPPVDTDRHQPNGQTPDDFDLIVSALVPYKRVDLAVSAYSSNGRALKIVGIGGELNRLKAMASDNIEFLEWQSDETVLDLYQRCRMLIFPGEEDFGIVPLEAQACGRPVVAFARGGALETIVANETGVFFDSQTPEALAEAVNTCANATWDVGAIRANALKFATPHFIQGISAAAQDLLKQPNTPSGPAR